MSATSKNTEGANVKMLTVEGQVSLADVFFQHLDKIIADSVRAAVAHGRRAQRAYDNLPISGVRG